MNKGDFIIYDILKPLIDAYKKIKQEKPKNKPKT